MLITSRRSRPGSSAGALAGTIACGLVAGLAVTLAPAAAAATDTTAPKVVVPRLASFAVGSSIGASGPDVDRDSFTDDIAQTFSWSASDASGICGSDVAELYAGDAPRTLMRATGATSFTARTTDYDDQEGGGSFKVTGWRVTVHDCAGNTTVRQVRGRPTVVQETGRDNFGSFDTAFAYGPGWSAVSGAGFSTATARTTTRRGASVVVTRDNWTPSRFALVMPVGPGHGQVDVTVAGRPAVRVDTGAATAADRVVVWQTWLPAGTSTVTVTNVGTSGRPAVTLDAVLTTS